jgi:hypothetical protein
MKRLAILAALLGLALTGSVLVVTASGSHAPPVSVLSATALQRQLAHDPQRWLGRTLLVRGVAIARGCRIEAGTLVLCSPRQVFLTDPGPKPQAVLTDLYPMLLAAALPLVSARPDPLLTVMRHLPLLGRVLPPPQVVHWGRWPSIGSNYGRWRIPPLEVPPTRHCCWMPRQMRCGSSRR